MTERDPTGAATLPSSGAPPPARRAWAGLLAEHRPCRPAGERILAGAGAGARERALFLTEARAAARLQHPNIVQVYEVGEDDGQPYLALEFVDGPNLRDLLGGRPCPPPRAARLLLDLARAMHY